MNLIENKIYSWQDYTIKFLENGQINAFRNGNYIFLQQNVVQVDFGLEKHKLTFNEDYTKFTSVRESDGEIIKGELIDNFQESSLTCVSGYWKICNKHGNEYEKWFENTLKINCPYIFFCDKETVKFIQKYRINLPTYYIELNIEDFISYKFKDQMITDPIHCPSIELNLIWNEKIFMIQHALKVNPFNSEYFCWIDAGICVYRDLTCPTTIFPDINKLNKLPKDKIIYSSSNDYDETKFVKCNYHSFQHVSGTSYILHKNIIDKVVKLYSEYLKLIDKDDIWTDQVILTTMYKNNKELFYKYSDGYGAIIPNLYKTIILIGPGNKNIPPKGWGACESIVWDYYNNLLENYNVKFISEPNIDNIIKLCNNENPDYVHIMYDEYYNIADKLNCEHIFLTTHFAYITNNEFENQYEHYFKNIFSPTISMQKHYKLIALSQEVADVYISNGFNKSNVKVLRNGAREDLFKYTTNPKFKHKSIYIGKIELRKAQCKYQSIESIDFAGNYSNSTFDVLQSNYLGEWDKDTLYNNLTEYGNLILLSDGEADPLVVKEALIAGLGLVLSEVAVANLDLDKPYITVIPNDKLENIEYVKEQVENNRAISLKERENIRKYGLDKFSWKNIIEEYRTIIEMDKF